ncbi:MAG TPA: hypothetical protein VL995_18175 [Cellvibrio sp.]|nr:hypothetical protein [Cellvibrio sp.]
MKSGSQTPPVSPNNPFHTRAVDAPFITEQTGALDTIKQGVNHEVDDLVKLELTAEQMLDDKVQLAREYVKDDTGHFWSDLKQEFVNWELATGQLLLTAADPTRVDWHEHHWWGDDESQFH